jgi:hypothetical protein
MRSSAKKRDMRTFIGQRHPAKLDYEIDKSKNRHANLEIKIICLWYPLIRIWIKCIIEIE